MPCPHPTCLVPSWKFRGAWTVLVGLASSPCGAAWRRTFWQWWGRAVDFAHLRGSCVSGADASIMTWAGLLPGSFPGTALGARIGRWTRKATRQEHLRVARLRHREGRTILGRLAPAPAGSAAGCCGCCFGPGQVTDRGGSVVSRWCLEESRGPWGFQPFGKGLGGRGRPPQFCPGLEALHKVEAPVQRGCSAGFVPRVA